MSRKVAFCLVENDRGEILFVQRAYGERKGQWSLPGGFVDRGESSRHAAYREVREETGITVKVTHRLFTGNTNPVKVFAGRPVGGKLRFQRRECLDVRWRNPARIKPEELAFGGDMKALQLWADIKIGKAEPERYYTSQGAQGSSSGEKTSTKRERATALVVRNGKYLLVKEIGRSSYSLPWGGMERDEAALTAACRGVGEELSLKAYKAERLFDYESAEGSNVHKVVMILAGGEPKINDRSLDSFLWWDGSQVVGMYPHVASIIARYKTETLG